jgi:hypothetical protein
MENDKLRKLEEQVALLEQKNIELEKEFEKVIQVNAYKLYNYFSTTESFCKYFMYIIFVIFLYTPAL